MRLNSISETIGNTPCVKINNLGPKHVNLYVKLESFNPMASIKDRMAINIIEQAEKDGSLSSGQTVIEATSGNAGIALAMVCAQKGYPFVAVMPENFSIERRKLMRFLGAKVVLTPQSHKATGALAKAKELAQRHGWYYCHQFENEANTRAHLATAKEILNDFADVGLHYWVTGYGTGGTLKGVGGLLKLRSPRTKIVVCEPSNAQLLTAPELQQRNADGSASESHPRYEPHMMQGWTPDFISNLSADALKKGYIDEIVPVGGSIAMDMARKLALKEGILTGFSGGAALAGALKIAAQAKPGSNILCMLPDSAERYISTPLFENIADNMSGEEKLIAESTPNYRFDSPPPLPVIEVEERAPLVSETIQNMLRQLVQNPKHPVVVFALQWCEISWAVRKLFKQLSIPYHCIELDSSAYRGSKLGSRLKASLIDYTGYSSLPQVFIGGELLGGSNELFDAVNNRSLFRRLDQVGVSHNKVVDIDPYTLLPGWMMPSSNYSSKESSNQSLPDAESSSKAQQEQDSHNMSFDPKSASENVDGASAVKPITELESLSTNNPISNAKPETTEA